jgi:hypothetical protein
VCVRFLFETLLLSLSLSLKETHCRCACEGPPFLECNAWLVGIHAEVVTTVAQFRLALKRKWHRNSPVKKIDKRSKCCISHKYSFPTTMTFGRVRNETNF